MRKISFYIIATVILVSCGSVSRTMFGATETTLIKTVSIEQNCDKEKVKIIDKVKGLHGATYSIDACGKRVVYKQIGTVFMEASQADKTIDNLKDN